jgi:hypothetical protein
MRWQVIVLYAYKIEGNSTRSRCYVIRKLLRHEQLLTVYIEDSNLGLVNHLLSYPRRKPLMPTYSHTLAD